MQGRGGEVCLQIPGGYGIIGGGVFNPANGGLVL